MTKELKNPYFYNSITNWKLNMNKSKKNFKKLNIYFMLGFILTITLSVIIKHFIKIYNNFKSNRKYHF